MLDTVNKKRYLRARSRVGLSAMAGVVAGIVMVSIGLWRLAPLAAWDVAAVVYITWVWATVGRMDARQTASHAKLEDPTRATADLVLLLASTVSLLAVGLVIAHAKSLSGAGSFLQVAFGVLSVVVSWTVVHTVYMLRYARLYHDDSQGGVDFGHDKPTYIDFAYLAFTIGMTFQVSDTTLGDREMRANALRHALLSYVFGTGIVATTINLIAGLGK